MERHTVELRDEAYSALRDAAESHGLSVEQELGELVARTYGSNPRHVPDTRRLRQLARGLDFVAPPRQTFVVDAPDL